MKLVVGLGNPGREYAHTRHNAGFMALDYIADRCGVVIEERKHRGYLAKTNIEGEKVLFLKPQTYMNLSGESVRSALDYYKLSPEDVVVIFDDISLDPGKLRIRLKGSAGGHNGIKSIIAHLGSQDFLRIKIGVGGKPPRMDLADYVLGRFSKEEEALLEETLENTYEALKFLVAGQSDKAMNMYN